MYYTFLMDCSAFTAYLDFLPGSVLRRSSIPSSSICFVPKLSAWKYQIKNAFKQNVLVNMENPHGNKVHLKQKSKCPALWPQCNLCVCVGGGGGSFNISTVKHEYYEHA